MFNNPIPKQYQRPLLLNIVAFTTAPYLNHLSKMDPNDIGPLHNVSGCLAFVSLVAMVGYECYKQLTEKPPVDALHPRFLNALAGAQAPTLALQDIEIDDADTNCAAAAAA